MRVKASLPLVVAFALLFHGCGGAPSSIGGTGARGLQDGNLDSASVAFGLTPVSYQSGEGPPISLSVGDGNALELVELQARSVVDGPLAFTQLHLTFDNPAPRMIEGRFRIVLPPRASVSRFAMKINDRWQEGEVVEKAYATKVYEDFLHKRVDPALLEQGAGNEFSARVYPIPAKARKELILSYSQELQAHERSVVPLAGMGEIQRVDVTVNTLGSDRPAQQLVRTNYRPTGDVVLGSQVGGSTDGVRHGDLAMMRVTPMPASQAEPLDSALLLIDTSGSRALGLGAEIDLATHLVKRIGATAGPGAPIAVACFDQDVELIYQGKAEGFGGPHKAKIEARRALGASDLSKALRWARKIAKREKLSRVLLITDGVVTAGPDEGRSLRAAAKALGDNGVKRLDAIAVGGIRDDALLASLVTAGLARDGVVASGRLPRAQLWQKLIAATESNIAIEVAGASWWWPRKVDGVQPGDQVLVYAKLPAGAPLALTVGGRKVAAPAVRPTERPLLERAWAQAKIRSLLEDERRQGRSHERRRAIVALSTQHRVLCPYTSLLVLEQEWHYERFNIDRKALADILTVKGGNLEVVNRSTLGPPSPATPSKGSNRWRAAAPPTTDRRSAGWEPDRPVGQDPLTARGNMWGDAIGDSFGAGGLGLSGIGEGGGGRGEGVELGSVGTTGHGAGTGTGQGFGSGRGRLGRSHRARAPRVRMGATSVSGRIPPEVIQRIVRQNFGRFRACYQQALVRDPQLAGRSVARFTIQRSGKVTAVNVGGAIADTEMQRCLGSAFSALTFPQPEGGVVTVSYPLLFTPDGTVPTPAPSQSSSPQRVARPQVPNPRPADTEPKPAAPYQGKLAKVMQALSDGQVDEALKTAQRWHGRAPGDVLALVALGEALEAAGKHRWAARAYGSIIDMFPARADLRRYAGSRLERVRHPAALALAVDTYGKAKIQRSDHPSSHRLYAYALLKSGRHREAFDVLSKATVDGSRWLRFRGAQQVLAEDLGLIAAAWIAAAPKERTAILGKLAAAGGALEDKPSLRFVLTWETDANDVDFHVYDGKGHAYYDNRELPSGGYLYADVTSGFGPECFTVRLPRDKRAARYRLQAHYFSRGPMGYGMGKVQVVEHDGKGGLTFDERPFVVMVDKAYVDLGSYSGRSQQG
ncbi:MAG: AgmX/PglI C-terminal domain-containing protein [Deltaproteobacteria bacterium]|nr:AgmX/PglI C-terminal domain-containing protein [Deltaproteobacteria bacterium]